MFGFMEHDFGLDWEGTWDDWGLNERSGVAVETVEAQMSVWEPRDTPGWDPNVATSQLE